MVALATSMARTTQLHRLLSTRAVALAPTEAPNPLRGEAWLSGARDGRWWTARQPEAGTPGVDADGRVRGLPAIDVRALSRQSLQAYLDNAAMVDDALFAGLHGEQSFLELAPHKLRKPQVFYYGHAAAFNVNKLLLGGLISESERVNPAFEQLFEAGVDEHPHEKGWAKSQWPAVAEVLEYRKAVHRLVSRVIARVGDEARGVAVDQTHPVRVEP
ncbi:hypothetical protein T492DRAFT_526295 [Pavlovales sp. CCMP2436]|nr:hypothetical protein T492DRAFT_526295 [Pavlovales sp. CCMP2436]